ncbi:MAG: hypothetical protein JNL12_12525 [Planctomycetes bacterium]|nr:hypothetical protein [Planctomycetota bacterium]
MASAPDLWTMLCTGMALLGAARWRARFLTEASPETAVTRSADAEPAPPLRASDEPAPRRSA